MSNDDLNLDTEYIECATVALIREYLARKGFRQTLETFDQENPKNEKSLNSRSKLIDYLCVQKLYEKNKSLKNPFKTIFELLISYHSCDLKKSKEVAQETATSTLKEMNFKSLKISSKKKNDDLQIDDADEGETYDGRDKRIESKKLDEEKFSYDFRTKPKVTPATKKQEEKPSNGFKTNTLGETSFESKLEEKARKLSEKKESDKNELINDLKFIEKKQEPTPKRTFHLNTNNSNRTNSSSNENYSFSLHSDPKDYTVKAIDFETAKNLRMLLFGNLNQIFSEDWRNQSFTFCDLAKLKFGIVQKKGGPCGVLASVQSYVLLDLVFLSDETKEPNMIFNVSKRDRTKSLAKGLAYLIWKCSEETNQAILTIPTQQAHFAPVNKYKSDGLTETLNLFHFSNYANLENFMLKNVNIFEADGTNGCILLLYSAILSRTINKVISDMDVADSKLMGMHGYCTQEMVNLLIHGRAVSNVFNDSVFLDKLELRGPNKRNDIGFLSLFEHYKSCEVGSYYKTPKYPIWVVCSESHFSVVFAIRKDILNDWKAETCFDLYYYDGLGKQDEQIRLTLSASSTIKNEDPFFSYLNKNKKSEKDLTPPLELVLKTKWKEANIDWNSTEPLL